MMKVLKQIEENIIGASLITSVILVFYNVVMRYIFKESSVWIEEAVRFLMVWVTFIGAAVCFGRGTHMGIDLIFSFVKGGPKKVVEFIILLASLVFLIFMFKYGLELVLFTKKSGQISPAMGIKLYWIYIAMPFGAFLSGIEVLNRMFKLGRLEEEI